MRGAGPEAKTEIMNCRCRVKRRKVVSQFRKLNFLVKVLAY